MIEVTAACIHKDGRILIARRRPGLRMAGLWEFPGGKIESGESPEACLERELAEEFAIGARVKNFLLSVEHTYERGPIRLHFYETEHVDGTFQLREHDSIKWVTPAEMIHTEFAPADIPFVKWLQRFAC